MSILNYKGYTGSVEFSQEDNCLYGKFLFIAESQPPQQDSE